MYEVLIKHSDGRGETYTALDRMQAQCIFFRARMRPSVHSVELFEIINAT
jgi:hypothetical protein